jgi:hypothetical protein
VYGSNWPDDLAQRAQLAGAIPGGLVVRHQITALGGQGDQISMFHTGRQLCGQPKGSKHCSFDPVFDDLVIGQQVFQRLRDVANECFGCITTVRLKVEQIQLVSAAWHLDLGCIGLQGA